MLTVLAWLLLIQEALGPRLAADLLDQQLINGGNQIVTSTGVTVPAPEMLPSHPRRQ
jgi:hypothetical protein